MIFNADGNDLPLSLNARNIPEEGGAELPSISFL